MAVLESGDLKGKKIGATLADLPRRADGLHVPVTARWPARFTALEKHACPACGAQAEWNPGKQKLVCPFCGTESPYQIDRETGKVVELDLVTALRELPDEERGWQTARRSVQCQSCRAVMVFDPERVGQNCEFCGSPALVGLRRDQGADPSAGRPAVQDRHEPRARRHPPLVAQQVVRARAARRRGARGHRSQPLHPVLDLRRAGALSRGTPRPATTTTSTSPGRDSKGRPVMRPRAAHAMGAGVRRRRSLLRRRARAGDAGAADRSAASGRAVSDAGDRALRHGVSLRPRRRALQGRADRRGPAVAGADARQAAGAVRAAGARRHPSQPAHPSRAIAGRTFKHVLVPVWLLSYNYGAKAFQVIVNGYTGEIAGNCPYSVWKIFFAVLAARHRRADLPPSSPTRNDVIFSSLHRRPG